MDLNSHSIYERRFSILFCTSGSAALSESREFNDGEVSLLFGYKRLGKNVETRIAEGIQWAKGRGDILADGKIYRVP